MPAVTWSATCWPCWRSCRTFIPLRNPRRWAVLIPLLVLAVPLLDMVWVVILRWRMGQPFYVGDTNHLSHRLVRRGLSRTRRCC